MRPANIEGSKRIARRNASAETRTRAAETAWPASHRSAILIGGDRHGDAQVRLTRGHHDANYDDHQTRSFAGLPGGGGSQVRTGLRFTCFRAGIFQPLGRDFSSIMQGFLARLAGIFSRIRRDASKIGRATMLERPRTPRTAPQSPRKCATSKRLRQMAVGAERATTYPANSAKDLSGPITRPKNKHELCWSGRSQGDISLQHTDGVFFD